MKIKNKYVLVSLDDITNEIIPQFLNNDKNIINLKEDRILNYEKLLKSIYEIKPERNIVEYKKELEDINKINENKDNISKENTVFISYAWDTTEFNEKVLSFCNYLRENGYNSKIDIQEISCNSSVHFPEMMSKNMNSDKVIVVLTESYKDKADNFLGGVGQEFRYIISEIAQNENKYILVSFNGIDNNIVPNSLKGRNIIDLKQDELNGFKKLFSKLSDVPLYEFSEVSSSKPEINPIKLPKFTLNNNDIKPLNFIKNFEYTDLDKEEFLEKSFKNIIDTLKQTCDNYCENYLDTQFKFTKINTHKYNFALYKNGNKKIDIYFFINNMFGSNTKVIGINNTGENNNYIEYISVINANSILELKLNMNFLNHNKDLIECIWNNIFSPYLR